MHGQSVHLVTLVERKTRYTLFKSTWSKNKKEVGYALIELLGNGGEFSDQVRVNQQSNVAINLNYIAGTYDGCRKAEEDRVVTQLSTCLASAPLMQKVTN
jgi:hypothetical protein